MKIVTRKAEPSTAYETNFILYISITPCPRRHLFVVGYEISTGPFRETRVEYEYMKYYNEDIKCNLFNPYNIPRRPAKRIHIYIERNKN
jgi:hypothetical protein